MEGERTTDWPAVRLGVVTALGLCSGIALILLFVLFGSMGLWALDVGNSGIDLLASVLSGFLVILLSVTLLVPVVAGLSGGTVAGYRSAGGLTDRFLLKSTQLAGKQYEAGAQSLAPRLDLIGQSVSKPLIPQRSLNPSIDHRLDLLGQPW